MSPDVFLSRNGLRYGGNASDLPGTPAEIMDSLILFNNMRIWHEDTGTLEWYRYATPGFISAPISSTSFLPDWVRKEQIAIEMYKAAKRTGKLQLVYPTVDEINRIRMAKGGAAWTADTDFEILASGPGPVGAVGRKLIEYEVASQESTSSPSWFFTKAAFDAINSYAKG